MKFADLSLDNVDRRRADMSEFWGDGVVIFSTPVTAFDMKKIAKRHPNIYSAPTPEAVIDLLIMKAENAQGDAFFTIEDKGKLMRRPVVEIETASKCLGDMEPLSDDRVDEAEKN